MNGIHIIFENKCYINCLFLVVKFVCFHVYVAPLQQPRNYFHRYGTFLKKNGDIFDNNLWDYVQQDNVIFSSSFRGPRENFHKKKLKRIRLFGKWEYELKSTINWLTQWSQNFWLATNFATFWSKSWKSKIFN